jgi:tRNA G18 (ribose-2'-O)-methylase SpoU
VCQHPAVPEPAARVIRVERPDDPRVADLVALRDPDLRVRVEEAGGFFVAESPRVIETVARSGRRIRAVLVTPHQHAALAPVLAGVDAPVFVAEPAVLRQVVGFDLHRGAVAAVDRWPLPPPSEVLRGAALVAAVEGLNDHENLGVLFRNAAAFGLDGVLLDPYTADPWYRRCVRVSIGHVCTVPWTRYAHLGELRDAGFTLVALTPEGAATAIDEVDWPARTALMLGAEGPGLTASTLAAADLRVRIPIRGDVDSLNVASAAAVAFHAVRRRR